MTRDESQVSVGGLLALDQVLGNTWSCSTIFGTLTTIEGGAPYGENIMGSWPTFWSIFGFWEYVTGMGCQPMGLAMFRPILNV